MIYRILKAEIQMFRYLYAIRNKMNQLEGYNLLEAYRMLDFNNGGTVCQYKIFTFLRDNDYIATTEEILAVIRRIDTTGDEKITFKEF